MTDKTEVLELAKKCGADTDTVNLYQFSERDLFAFASALRDQYAGQVAMLREHMNCVGGSRWWGENAQKMEDAIAQTAEQYKRRVQDAERRATLEELQHFIKWYVSEREARLVFASIDERDSFVKMLIGSELHRTANQAEGNGEK